MSEHERVEEALKWEGKLKRAADAPSFMYVRILAAEVRRLREVIKIRQRAEEDV